MITEAEPHTRNTNLKIVESKTAAIANTDFALSANANQRATGDETAPAHELEIRRGALVPAAPRVSVVIPAFNIAEFVAETLGSVFAQTFDSFEVLLVNDGSEDTLELERAVEPFRDRIVYLKQTNLGAAAARNAGVKTACAALVAFLDGDDVWLPDFLASQIEFLERTGADMVYADALLFGNVAQADQTYMQFSVSEGAVTTISLLDWTCSVITSGTVVRRAALVGAGLFDESAEWRRGQDYEMWFRLLKRGARIEYQKRVLLKYRVRDSGLTGNTLSNAARNITALAGLRRKFDLTPAEETAWRRQTRNANAIWHVENGKAQILNHEFARARQSFAAANRERRQLKLQLVSLMLRFAPDLLRRIFARRAAPRD